MARCGVTPASNVARHLATAPSKPHTAPGAFVRRSLCVSVLSGTISSKHRNLTGREEA
jgi:hypothetical protein